MTETFFDRLPIELFYKIRSYLSCNHIIRAFHSISEYLNTVLISYDHYLLDLSSSTMEKGEFDFICSFLPAEQILGLKLAKNRFNIVNRLLIKSGCGQALTRLSSLWIDETFVCDQSFAKQIPTPMIDYNKLISLRLDQISFPLISKLQTFSFKSLSRLVVCSSKEFRKLSVRKPRHLTFLHMFFDSVKDLNYFLLPNAYQLKSLGVGIRFDANNIHQFASLFKHYPWTQLIQFNLNLTSKNKLYSI